MDDGAYTDLGDLHRQLDHAVAVCYGWPASIAQDDTELVHCLRTLNQKITEGDRVYSPFAEGADQLF